MHFKKKVLQGSASNTVRLLLSTLVALVLPPFLVHRMSATEYSAWVLILQVSAYVNFLELGVQTAIGKFVAEYDAANDRESNYRLVSTSFTTLAVAALVGSAAIGVVAWRVPQLFHQMPVALIPVVRFGILAVGLSIALCLPFGAFLSIFTGLQQYGFPTVVAMVSRIATAVTLILVLLANGSLVQLALIMAGFNIATAAAQFLGWRKYASERVEFSFFLFDRRSAVRLAKYCGGLSVSTVAMLFISGLDTLIVGHYDYKNTGFYAIASSATTFMVVVISSLFGPLLPAISSMQSSTVPSRIGELSIRATRYCALFICGLGLPMIAGAYPLLSLWVGHQYAARSALFLEILVAGNMVRQLGYPYALFVAATGKQHLATGAAIAEAMVNFALSICLAQRMGAIGVALGTLVGAFVSVGVHLTVSMHYTQSAILIRRSRFLLEGLLRPLVSIAPSLLLYPFWRSLNMVPASPALLVVWVSATAGILWKIGLTAGERRGFQGNLFKLAFWRLERT